MDPQENSYPTMRELAEALGISATTVSMALRNHPRVAAETRREVQAFAREKGYQLNPLVTSLMSRVRFSERAQYRETVAWLNLWNSPDHFTHAGVEYHRHLWEGARQRAAKLGYTLDNFWLAEPDMTARRVSGILAARGIRGLLIPPLPTTCGHLSINWKEFTAVALSYTMARPQPHRVVPDHHNNMWMILRHLRRRSYKRAGLLIHKRFDERTENRMRSAFYFYQHTLAERDRVPVLLCSTSAFKAEAAAWLKRFRPDAVITLGRFRHLRKIDIGDASYSRNLGVVLMGHAETDSGFAAVDENPFQIGATAIDHLAAQLSRNERGIPPCPETVLIKGLWVQGGSLRQRIGLPERIPELENAASRLHSGS